MNKLLIDNTICWNTNKTNGIEAIDELFETIMKYNLPLDINISGWWELRDSDYKIIDQC